jgi:hypothetical protein
METTRDNQDREMLHLAQAVPANALQLPPTITVVLVGTVPVVIIAAVSVLRAQ